MMKLLREWPEGKEQTCTLGDHTWSVPRLWVLASKLPVMEVPLAHMNLYIEYKKLSLRDMVMHMKAADKADLAYPIILDEDGEVLDGRHRIMKALFTGEETIKAVRFEENPSPCSINE